MKNPYEVLGVSSLDDISVIKAEYRKLCKKYHPDIVGPKGIEKFREINEAWNTIKGMSNENKGKQYWSHETLFTIKQRSI